jgi:hypothetical protein
MSKHTPGPWEVGGYGGVVIPVNRNGSIICSMHGRDSTYQGDNCKDNARLIAAAPDLLEALKEFVHPYQSVALTERERNEKALAAIAKAEGRP